ncbi:MAG: O-antigen ligase family protein [Chloroflexi bacterium]|nr:O-antigen ligase family protein [Chloroflexota bacterium]
MTNSHWQTSQPANATSKKYHPPASRWAQIVALLLLVASVVIGVGFPSNRARLGLPPVLSDVRVPKSEVAAAHVAVVQAAGPFSQAWEAATRAGLTTGKSRLPALLTVASQGSSSAQAALDTLSADARLLAALASASAQYQAAIVHYDNVLMARSRSLGPKVEQLRSDTWPFVEWVKQFPPPLGLTTSLHPGTSATFTTLAERLAQDAQQSVRGAQAVAGADARSFAAVAADTIKVASLLPNYRHLLEVYDGEMEKVASEPGPTAHGARLIAGDAITGVLFILLSLGSLLLLIQPLLPRMWWIQRGSVYILGFAAVFALFLIGSQAAAALAAVALFIIALVEPVAGVTAVAATIPFFFHPRAVGHLHFPPAEIALTLTVLAVIVRSLLERRLPLVDHPWRLSLLDFLAAVFFLSALLSLTVPPHNQLHIALRYFRWVALEPLALYVLLTRLRLTPAQLVLSLTAFTVVLIGTGWLAVGQFLTESDTWTNGGVARALGVDPSATALGIELGRAVAIVLALALFAPQSRTRAGAALLALVGAGGLFVSFTRGAWIAVAASIFAVAVVRRSWRVMSTVTVLAAIGLVAIASSHIERLRGLFNLKSGSNAARLEIWRGSLEMLREHVLRGIGLDQFLNQHPERYGIPELRFFIVSHPHNVFLDAWLQLGLLGFLSFTALIITGLFLAFRMGTARLLTPERAWALALFSALIDVSVHGFVDEGYFTGDLALTFWLIIGSIEVLRRRCASDNSVSAGGSLAGTRQTVRASEPAEG